MPRKKKISIKDKTILAKQTKMIASRLMEISLKLDDYIYKNISIPESAAELYIQEVSSYRAICCQDDRSLQVIEKIIRCMKGIIAEVQEQNQGAQRFEDHHVSSCVPSQDFVAIPSPVYSLTGEDLQLTQGGHKFVKFNEDRMDADDIIDLCHKSDIIENNNGVVQEDNIIVANVQKNISKLFIGNVEHGGDSSRNIFDNTPECDNTNFKNNKCEEALVSQAITEPNTEASQSILVNFNINSAKMNEISNINFETINSYLKPTTKPSGPQAANIIDVIKMRSSENITGTKEHAGKRLTFDSSSHSEMINDVPQNRNSIWIKNHTEIGTPAIIEKSILKDISSSILNNVTKKTVTILNSNENFKPKKACKRSLKNNNGVQLQDENKMTKRAPKTVKNNNLPKIYRKDTVNDLSWVENIRYVREITMDEYDEGNLQDDFWENYTLPDMWDDREFDYI